MGRMWFWELVNDICSFEVCCLLLCLLYNMLMVCVYRVICADVGVMCVGGVVVNGIDVCIQGGVHCKGGFVCCRVVWGEVVMLLLI